MESKNWAQNNNVEATSGLSKPWLLIQRWLDLLQDQQETLGPKTRLAEQAELRQVLMNLGEWWQSLEAAVFGTEHPLGERG